MHRPGGATAGRATSVLDWTHALSAGSRPSFALHAGPDGTFRITGEVDVVEEPDAELITATFGTVLRGACGRTVLLDCSNLRYIDHRALLLLDAAAQEHDVQLDLLAPPAVLGRVASLLSLQRVRIVL